MSGAGQRAWLVVRAVVAVALMLWRSHHLQSHCWAWYHQRLMHQWSLLDGQQLLLPLALLVLPVLSVAAASGGRLLLLVPGCWPGPALLPAADRPAMRRTAHM